MEYSATVKKKKKKKKKERKKKKLTFHVTAWKDLENIMLSEIRQSKKDKYHMITLICGI